MTKHVLLGQTLTFSGNPFETDWESVTHLNSQGAVLIEGEKIHYVGDDQNLTSANHDAKRVEYGNALILT